MSKMTIMRGASGSGKTSWAKAQPGALVVSRDAIRASTFGSDGQDYYAVPTDVLRRNEDIVTAIQNESIAAGLRAGMHVIVDNTNVKPRYIKSIVDIAHSTGAEIDVKVMDVPLDVAIARNASRASSGGRFVPERVIRAQHQALRSSIDWTPETPFVPEPYHGTPGKPVAFMVDIDGTLAQMKNHRGPFDWDKVGLDEPDEVIVDIVNVLSSSNLAMGLGHYTVIVMSGRDAVCRPETEAWLDGLIEYDHLFMRPEGDMRKDTIIKAELFDKHIRDNFDVRFALDDRASVVRMWKQMGIKVLNCSGLDNGEF